MQLTRLGPYVIEKPLGKGGMGTVYAASDPQTGQQVAIKALSPHLAAAEGFRERFEAEIESLKTLRHDGIVRLFGYGEQDGVLFYSMELVDGISLEEELRAGRRFNWREVSNIAIQVSLALKHAHDHGIVHRDIKPANILLTKEERVKLADFGIARLFGMTSLTTAGGVLGTADYMSPEQADGRPVTARCDQYSLGGVMYALLAGRPPFRAKNLPQMLQLQRFANPEPVRRYAPDTPEQLESVITQLLAKEPSARFPNTQVLARHLQAMVNALTRPAADDFALTPESPNAKLLGNVGESISSAATQADPQSSLDIGGFDSGPKSSLYHASTSQNAITLGAEESAARENLRSVSIQLLPEQAAPVAQPVERPARFTTVEEEEAARSAQQQKSWLFIAAQLVAVVAIVGTVAGGFAYLSRPVPANTLYAAIMSRVDSEDDASLGKVEDEVNDFLTRFPEDTRANELRGYQEQIELDKLERKLQRQAREVWAINTTLLPVERLYLEAKTIAARAPERSVGLLSSLIDLYDVPVLTSSSEPGKSVAANKKNGERATADRTAAVVRQARRRIKSLTSEVEKQHDQQLASLRDRLAVAEQLKSAKPEQAAAMCRAILNLHENDQWAAAAVVKARSMLAEMGTK